MLWRHVTKKHRTNHFLCALSSAPSLFAAQRSLARSLCFLFESSLCLRYADTDTMRLHTSVPIEARPKQPSLARVYCVCKLERLPIDIRSPTKLPDSKVRLNGSAALICSSVMRARERASGRTLRTQRHKSQHTIYRMPLDRCNSIHSPCALTHVNVSHE